MGGKNKPNRTKNNTRPSSSARSAELLGTQPTAYFGFGVTSDKNVATYSEIDVNGSFQVVLKKMTKKDAITKLKALQEFSELCVESGVDSVKAVLPYWARIYCQLCGDADHRVREAAHVSHKSVIAIVKKYLAPYLKEIIGPWFTSQFDTHAPSASAAVAAFEEAFSPQKFAEAIAFCQDEILAYYLENLTVHTAQTLANTKACSNEEKEEKYRRVVTSSLLGYASYLQKITKSQILRCEEANRKLVKCAKFWKLANNNDPLIRHGFFTVLASLCEHAAWLVETEAPRLSATLFNNTSEDDPLVLPVMWDAVLIGVVAVPECWKYGNVVKQLHHILKSGGQGHASNIFPKILPLLSTIPDEKVGDKANFLNLLFTNMRAGMSEPSVGKSRVESLTVARTFIESLQYFIMLNRENDTLVEQLVRDHLLATIKSKLTETPPPHGTTLPLFYHTAQLIRSWCRNISNYNSPVTQFWKGIQDIFKTCLDSKLFCDNAELNLKFIAVLQNPDQFLPKSGRDRVKFTDEEPTCDIVETIESDSIFELQLKQLAQILADSYIEKFEANDDQRILDAYLEVKKIFPSFERCGAKKLCTLFDSLVEKAVPAKTLTELCMLVLPYVSDEVAEQMLTTLSNLEDLDLLLYCRLLPCGKQNIVEWIQTDHFKAIYFNLLDQYLLGEIGIEAAAGLRKFLHPTLNLGPVFNGEILKKLTWAVTSKDVLHARIMTLIEECSREFYLSQEFQDFSIQLFTTLCVEGPSFSPLFILTLRKLRCRPEALLWDALVADMKNQMLKSEWNVDNLLDAVNIVVSVAFDVDLTEPCEATEMHEVLDLAGTVLEIPREFQNNCGKRLKSLIYTCKETLGECSLPYFGLKKNLSEIMEIESCELSSSLIQDFLKWLRFSCAFISQLVSAYPPAVAASTMLKEMNSDGAVNNLKSHLKKLEIVEEKYPGEELFATIRVQIVAVVEKVAMFGLFLTSCAESEYHPVVANHYPMLLKQTQDFIAATNPIDYALLYSSCAHLTSDCPFWNILKTVLPNIFDMEFDVMEPVASLRVEDIFSRFEETEKLIEIAAMVKEIPQCFSYDVWNQLFVKLDSLLKETEAKESSLLKFGALSNLFLIMQQHFKNCEENDVDKELVQVWKNVAERELWLQFYYKWRQYTPTWKPDNDGLSQKEFGCCSLRRFCEAFCAGLDLRPKEDSESLVDECISLLLSSQVCVQSTAFEVLLRLSENWVQDDMELFQANISDYPDNEDKWLVNQKMDCEWRLRLLSDILCTSQTVVEALLSDFKPGDTCTIKPFTDAFTYVHGYLLLWTLIYKMCSSAHFALKFQYASWLKEHGYLWILLDSVIKLMPASVVHGEPTKEIALLFKNPKDFSFKEAPCSMWIEHNACNIFRTSMQWVAGAVREWWSELEPSVANLVGVIASDHVSPLLIAAELRAVQNYSDSSMTISVSHQAREIIANYPIDDTIVQLGLIVPANYPLGTIKVESKTQNSVHRTMRVSLFLANRNCSLCDALLLWKSELDKRFEGIEPCHICYSLFYGGNCELPKQACSTCHKKFHSACLYKWFDTSNKSTCPYCRNKF